MSKTAIIIGAGPAGLTAAYELLQRTDIRPIILEKSGDIGGISKTINYKGNRMDMGPHRFFSKSDRVMDWWLNIMPLEEKDKGSVTINYQHKARNIDTDKALRSGDPDKTMLLIQRLTRIYFLRKFFAYPIQLSLDTLKTLGLIRTVKIMLSYLWIKLFPRKPEKSLEDFIINKFGRQLYLLFFKDYTEKVWGVPCQDISAEWGAQRIKGVSLSKAIGQAFKSLRGKKANDLGQKDTETSLIEQFLYPKYGPGSLWEEVARQVEEMGGRIYLNQDVQKIDIDGQNIASVTTVNNLTGQTGAWVGNHFFSTMPVQELIAGMGPQVPEQVREVAAGLQYRDFINVGILLKQLSANGEKLELKDNWIYIQERDVKVGRLMIYNNWGGGMIKDPNTTWIGMEYFCNKTDAFWAQDDSTIQSQAIMELEKMQLAAVDDVLDITVRRMEKTYPAYFGTYDRFDEIKAYVDQFPNLFLLGRNGMHKYNNADHSMLTAMVAVDNIAAGVETKANIWAINTEQEYHEVKEGEKAPSKRTPTPAWVDGQPASSFKDFIWNTPANRFYLLFAAAAFLVQYILFKFMFPYANYMPDSYYYIGAASSNSDVNLWPIAYSKFLRVFSAFVHTDKLLIAFQYLLLEAGGLYFLYTLCYFIPLKRGLKNFLFMFFIFNPIPLFLANFISPDALFAGFSFFWISQLFWIIRRPGIQQIFIQAVLLWILFMLRYNAIYYPFVAAFAFLIAKKSWIYRLSGVGLGVALITVSLLVTSHKMYLATGKSQFSPFGGWQMANNALYMYSHIPKNKRADVPANFRGIDLAARKHFDTTKLIRPLDDGDLAGIFYLWGGQAPLMHYMDTTWKKDTVSSFFKRWGSMGPLYTKYGLYLIKTYPIEFLQHFVIPNAKHFILPPPEFLGIYNMGGDSVGVLVRNWFDYKSQRVATPYKNLESSIFVVVPTFGLLTNGLFLVGTIWYIIICWNKRKEKQYLLYPSILTLCFWILNLFFSVFASPIVLRYQIFPILICLTFSLITIETADKESKRSITITSIEK